MSRYTAAQLDRYVKWAAAAVSGHEDEAMMLTIDQALALWFRRDHLFRASAENTTASETGGAPKASPVLPPVVTRPGLPPPSIPSQSGGTS